MNFDKIIGQRETVESLKNAVKYDRIGHAYVFTGPKGIGKRTVARVFAGLLLCRTRKDGEACGECLSCQITANGSNPDLHVIEADGASIGVDEVRNLQSDIIIKPLYSDKKVYLIFEADKMTVQAQNCLLKTLEEPPEYAVIILTAANYDALMETIRSRTVKYSFKKNTLDEVREFLKNGSGRSSRELDFIASYSDGIIGTAKELAESEEFAQIRERALEILIKLSGTRLMDVFDAYSFFEANKNNIDGILDIMLLFYRDLLVLKKTGKENVLINSDKRDMILSNASGFSESKLAQNIETVEQARRNLKHNANYQLTIEVMLMKLQEESAQW